MYTVDELEALLEAYGLERIMIDNDVSELVVLNFLIDEELVDIKDYWENLKDED